MTPNRRSIQISHSPERGRLRNRFVNVPSTRYGAPSPSENTKNERKPYHGSPLAPTTVSSATTGGPTHGAAITPTARPERNTPATLVALAPPTRDSSAVGAWN